MRDSVATWTAVAVPVPAMRAVKRKLLPAWRWLTWDGETACVIEIRSIRQRFGLICQLNLVSANIVMVAGAGLAAVHPASMVVSRSASPSGGLRRDTPQRRFRAGVPALLVVVPVGGNAIHHRRAGGGKARGRDAVRDRLIQCLIRWRVPAATPADDTDRHARTRIRIRIP